MGNRAVVDRWVQALQSGDTDALADLVHPDIVVSYPQSGEQLTGRDRVLAMGDAVPAWPEAEYSVHDGPRDSVRVLMPGPLSRPTITVSGAGDTFVVEGIANYADTGVVHTVMLLKLKDGKVISETSYFAKPFEPPEWRKPFVDG